MKKIWILLGLAVCLLGSGCGYTTQSALPPHLKSLYVETIKNKIDFTAERRRTLYYPLLEVKLREAIIDRFLFDGNLRIEETTKADMILTGELVNYTKGILRYTDEDEAEEYRVQIFMHLTLKDIAQDTVLWSQRIVGESTYFVRGALASSESAAVDAAMVDLARRVVERTVENW